MWMEIKALLTIIGCIFIAVVLSQILLINMFLSFFLFIGMFMFIFSDIVIGYQISHNHANLIIDKPPPNKVVIPIFTITGLLDFVWAEKKPHGKREFVYNKQEASVIDKGDYPIHLLNGAHGCLAIESYDGNINMFEVKYAEKLSKELGTDNLKEIYHAIKNKEKKEKLITGS